VFKIFIFLLFISIYGFGQALPKLIYSPYWFKSGAYLRVDNSTLSTSDTLWVKDVGVFKYRLASALLSSKINKADSTGTAAGNYVPRASHNSDLSAKATWADTANVPRLATANTFTVIQTVPKIQITNPTREDSAHYMLLWNRGTGEVKAGHYEPLHLYGYYSNNTGFTRAFGNQDTYYPLVVAITWPETHGFTGDGDSVQFKYTGASGHLKVDVSLSLTGTTNDDIELELYNVTDGAQVPTSQVSTVTGSSNRANISLNCYDSNSTTNDIYQLRIKNRAATQTITIYRIMIYGQIIHY
jgi:hypothetical protein